MADSKSYRALVADQKDGKTLAAVRELDPRDLPPGEVTVRLKFSSLNYKDGLALTGSAPILRGFPMVPGIDGAGIVEASSDARFQVGDQVVLTGWGVGERHPGCFAQMGRFKADWLVKLPPGMSLKHAMAIGTAGFTAMLSVLALEDAGIKPGGGPIVVSGAGGGVGSVGVALLAARGHEVHAVSGRAALEGFLKGLGAKLVIPRAEVAAAPDKPLLKERWAGGLDTVGGDLLAHLLAEAKYGAAIAACGLVGGTKLPTTVLPFILRGVRLLGIDSVLCPAAPRARAWRHLAEELKPALLDSLSETIPLSALPDYGARIIKGEVKGRVVVDLDG
jgi:acrylyl-CoA reductase (NADPH)